MYCLPSGWNGSATCQIKDCGNMTVLKGILETPGGTLFGDLGFVRCNEGYSNRGDNLLQCDMNGNWTGEPNCTIFDCGNPSPINGAVNVSTYTFGTVAEVNCTVGHTITGNPVITCGSNGIWSDSPICDPADCGHMYVSHGLANYSTTVLGSVAQLSCDVGYNLTGDSTIACTSGGWNGTAMCNIKDCKAIQFENGSVSLPSNSTYGSYAVFNCKEGYTLAGAQIAFCQDDETWTQFPNCSLIDCGLFDVENSENVVLNTTYGSEVNITCKAGYEMLGDPSVKCRSDSFWSPFPLCIPIDCGRPPVPSNALVNYTLTVFGSTAKLVCGDGYTLNGDDVLYCLSNGWNGSAECNLIDCSEPTIPNGNASLPTGTTYGEIAFVSCLSGYVLQGVAYITCEAGPVWSSQPECIKDCGNPSTDNGKITPINGTLFGALAKVICNTGYNSTGDTELVCGHPGWMGTADCTIQECEDPTPANGTLDGPDGFFFGAFVSVDCDTGYVLFGDGLIKCQHGPVWSDYPVCTRDCGMPSTDNGRITSINGTLFGAVSKVICNNGYNNTGDAELVCGHPGWMGSAVCTIQVCEDPTPLNGTLEKPDGLSFGETVFVHCDTGYVLIGDNVIKCQHGPVWSDHPVCTRDCGNPSTDNGRVIPVNGSLFGAIAKVTCNSGYNSTGDAELVCGHPGWMGSAVCTFQVCEDPTPENGTVYKPDGFSFGASVSVDCDTGYVLFGDGLIKCQHGPVWSDHPVCTRDCGMPSTDNGKVIPVNGTLFGAVSKVTCTSGYNSTGDTELVCGHPGWMGSAVCSLQVCEDPTPENGTVYKPDGFSFGASVSVDCDTGYVLFGDGLIKCQHGPAWSDHPVCTRDCGIPSTYNGHVTPVNGTLFGAVSKVTCNSGYNSTGDKELVCGHPGWMGSVVCTIQVCEDPTPANGTVYKPDGFSFGASVSVDCDTGYVLFGDGLIKCQHGPVWSDHPVCTRDCGIPSTYNGQVTPLNGTLFAALAKVICNSGYNSTGDAELVCGHPGWMGNASCEIQDCGDPTPANGLSDIPVGTKYGAVADISCKPNYVLVGNDSLIHCLHGPKWSYYPKCIRDCGSPAPENGRAYTPYGTTENQTAAISCNSGYNLNGSSSLTCFDSGWSGKPNCIIKDCGDPTPVNGSADIPDGTTYGEYAFIYCDDGFNMKGKSLIQCLASGTWSVNTSCEEADKILQSDKTFDFQTVLIFSLVIGFLVLVAIVIGCVCLYMTRCKRKKETPEPIDENQFGRSSHQDDWVEDDDFYPADLRAHPPPNSREAVPPLHFGHRSNVGIVPPMTKQTVPVDVLAAVDENSKHTIPFKGLGHKKGLPPVPEDLRQLHDSTLPNSRRTSPIEKKVAFAEISAPLDEIDEIAKANQQTEVNTLSADLERRLLDRSEPLIRTSAEIKLTPKSGAGNGAIPKPSADAKKSTVKPTSKLSEKVQIARKKLKSTITSVSPKTAKPGKAKTIPHVKKVESQKTVASVNLVTSEAEHIPSLDVARAIIIPTFDTEPSDAPEQSQETEKTTPENRASIIPTFDTEPSYAPGQSHETEETTHENRQDRNEHDSNPIFTKKLPTEMQSTPDDTKLDTGQAEIYDLETSQASHEESFEHKQKEDKDTYTIQPSVHVMSPSPELPPSPIPLVRDFQSPSQTGSPVKTLHVLDETTSESKPAERTGVHRTVTISSYAPSTMPSVEDVPHTQISPSGSEKTAEHDGTLDNTPEPYYSDSFSSESEEELAPPKPPKHFFLPESPDVLRKMAMQHAAANREDNDEMADHNERPKTEKPHKATSPHRTRESSRLLTSSYGSRPAESVKAYNPAADRDKDGEKAKEKKKKVEAIKRELERKRSVRLGAMSSVYGTTVKR
ncbi:hypothetical protein DPMN_041709 [Dreissena polymorpha]|uniref:Sushi domain-containing protein n=1 Tax=Dreissena polymorpha TaxID=45954 RepID=A0A9D4CZU1_DREPO|nr:hypothetical protein DPMN_041709 [Dreissena polymorpha]